MITHGFTLAPAKFLQPEATSQEPYWNFGLFDRKSQDLYWNFAIFERKSQDLAGTLLEVPVEVVEHRYPYVRTNRLNIRDLAGPTSWKWPEKPLTTRTYGPDAIL